MHEAQKILIVEGSGRGFLSHYAHALALGLHEAGRRVRLVTALRDELAGWPAPFERRASLRPGIAGWLDAMSETRSFGPDVVHFQWLADPVGAALYVHRARRRGVAVLYTPHNLLPHRGRWMTMPLFRRLYRVFDRIIARDAHMMWAAHEMLGVDLDHMTTITGSPNIIAHPQAPRRLPEEAPLRRPGEVRALHFGHGCARKGLEPMLRALAGRDCPENLHLVLAGAGVARSIGADVIAAARRRVRISIIGRYLEPDEVGGLFAETDLVTMPYGKLCRSPILDLAAAFAKPVLRTDRVEATHFVEGEHGLTVANTDAGADAGAFVDVLVRLARNPQTVAAMHDALGHGPGFAGEVTRLADAHASLYDRAVRDLAGQRQTAAVGPLAAAVGK